MIKSLVGILIIILGLSMIYISVRDDLSWQVQPLNVKVEKEIKTIVLKKVNVDLSKYAISEIKIENHSQFLNFLMNNKPIVFAKNKKGGDHLLEIDIIDLNSDEEFKGFILQMALKNIKTQNKEEEVVENVILKDIHKVKFQLPAFMQSKYIKPL